MRIVRQGRVPAKKEYRVGCDNCDTVFIFEEGEARYVSDQRDGDYLEIKCPTCKESVTYGLTGNAAEFTRSGG